MTLAPTPLLLGLGPQELIIILIILLLLFGGSRLAGLGKSSGRALKEFKEETKGLREDKPNPDQTSGAHAVLPPQQITGGQPGATPSPYDAAPYQQAPQQPYQQAPQPYQPAPQQPYQQAPQPYQQAPQPYQQAPQQPYQQAPQQPYSPSPNNLADPAAPERKDV